MTKLPFKVPPPSSSSRYRVVQYDGRAFLYSSTTNCIYPLDLRTMGLFERVGLDDEKLSELERASSEANSLPVPAPPDSESVRHQIHRALDKQVQQIVLAVTENCNLRCHYCVYSGGYAGLRTHSRARMPWVVARKAIDYLLQHSSESPVPPGVAFYGGEPLLMLPLIRDCVEYAKDCSDKEVRFVITTNGTLLGEQALDFLVKNDISVIVSLDGPPELHDRYRRDAYGRPSFERVATNIQTVKRKAPSYFADRIRFSVVLAPPVDYHTLETFFDKLGVPCIVSPMERYGLSADWRGQLNRLGFALIAASFEQSCRDRKELTGNELWRRFSVGLLGPPLRRIQARANRPDATYFRLGQCVPGARKVFVNPRGEMYPCEKVEGGPDVRIGHVETGISKEAVERLTTRFTELVAERCATCWMRRMCSGCLADVVHGGRFDPRKMDLRCQAREEAQSEALGLYAALLQDDEQALDFLPDAMPWA